MAQGTIKDFDAGERTGSLLMEDRAEVAIDAISVEGSGLLSLRIGQRVRFDLVEESGRQTPGSRQVVPLCRTSRRATNAWRTRAAAWRRPSLGTPCRR